MQHFLFRTSAVLAVTALLTLLPLSAQAPKEKRVSRGDLFIKAFGPVPSPVPLLRARQLEEEETVRMAFDQIDHNLIKMAAGTLAEDEGNRYNETFKQVIRDYMHDQTKFLVVDAARGRASDVPAISQRLGPLLVTGQRDALSGQEQLAQEAQAYVVKVLTTFSKSFAQTCELQKFPIELALELQRQNLKLETGIDVWHCAGRRVTADISRQGVNYHFETCTLRGDGDWNVTVSGRVTGTGKGRIHTNMGSGEGTWEGRVVYQGLESDVLHDLQLKKQDVPEPERPPAAAPVVGGAQSRPNGWPQEPEPPLFHPIPQSVTLLTLRSTTVTLRGEHGFNGFAEADSWAEAEVIRGEEPCRARDPYPHSARE